MIAGARRMLVFGREYFYKVTVSGDTVIYDHKGVRRIVSPQDTIGVTSEYFKKEKRAGNPFSITPAIIEDYISRHL